MNQRGFNLIEVVIAIAIITIGLLSIISLFSSNIRNEIKSRDKLIAVYLANESIEVVRQQRDNNWFKGVGWRTGIPIGEVIIVPDNTSDINSGWSIKSIVDESNKKVYLDTSNIYFQRDVGVPANWQETRFERYLTINENHGGGVVGCLGVTDCMEIVSRVSSNGVQLVELTTYFYDGWY